MLGGLSKGFQRYEKKKLIIIKERDLLGFGGLPIATPNQNRFHQFSVNNNKKFNYL